MYLCKLCNKEMKNAWAFLSHLKWDHHVSEESLESFIELTGDKILIGMGVGLGVTETPAKKIEEKIEKKVEKKIDDKTDEEAK